MKLGRRKEKHVEASSGLIVVQYELTPEQKRQRRQDNKLAKQSHKWHRRRKKHGRQ
jgi:hypothetical protein